MAQFKTATYLSPVITRLETRLMASITGVLVPNGVVKHSNDGTGVFDRKYLLTNLISSNAGKSKNKLSLVVSTLWNGRTRIQCLSFKFTWV